MGSSPGWTYGQVPTAGQWNAAFSAKQDDLGYTPVNRSGDTMEGPLVTAPSTAGAANLIVSEGVAPTLPANGDLWMTTSGLYYKAGNNVVGPLNNGVTAWKQAANYATTGPLPTCTYDNGTLGVGATLTANSNGALSIDGGAVTSGQRVLIKDQVAAADNGVYVVTQAGDAGNPWKLTRADDYNQFDNAQAGDSLNVLAGTANTNTFWVQVTTVAVMGTDPLAFQPFALAYQSGTGIDISGSTIAIDTSVTADLTSAQTLTNKTLVAPDLGTPSAIDLTNATGLPLTSGVTGILPSANGGTGAATALANLMFAGPSSGSAAAPGFRALVAADLPNAGAGQGAYGVTLNYFDYVPQAKQAGIAAGTDTTTDQATYWQAFRDALAAISAAGAIPVGIVPQCTIYTSTAPNFAMDNLCLYPVGQVKIIATGAVSGLNIDGTGLGTGGLGVRGMRVGPFLAGTTTGATGIVVSHSHHGVFDGLRSLGGTTYGIYVESCVWSRFIMPRCSAQDGALLATPTLGLEITGTSGDQTSWCAFESPIVEGPATGIELDYAIGNTLLSGGSENGPTGIAFGPSAQFNKIIATDCEDNSSFEIYCGGSYNEFHGADAINGNVTFDAGAIENRWFGGNINTLAIASTAYRNRFLGARITTINNAEPSTQFIGCLSGGAAVPPPWEPDWVAYTPTISSTGGTLTGASATGRYIVSGKTVTFEIEAHGGSGGSGYLLLSLPIASKNMTAFTGQEASATLKVVAASVSAASSTLTAVFYDGTYPGASGNVVLISGSYEIA